jgi:hypothetical protein
MGVKKTVFYKTLDCRRLSRQGVAEARRRACGCTVCTSIARERIHAWA